MQRRTFIKSAALAAGAAICLPFQESKAAEASAPFVLPPLGFQFNALEPSIDALTMEIHHNKHHKAYVDNLNKAMAEADAKYRSMSLSELLINNNTMPSKLRTAVKNQGGGHYNHSLFWQLLTPGGDTRPSGALARAIDAKFGNFDSFRKEFIAGASSRFGSGWEWLCQDPSRQLVLLSTANQDCPLSDGLNPLLGIDVWEHSYYLKYQNRRPDYLAAAFELLNWNTISQRYRA